MAETKAQPKTTLAAKLAKILGEVSRVPKSGWNAFHKYNYVTETDLTDAIRPLLANYNLAVTFDVEEVKDILPVMVPDNKKDVVENVQVCVRITITDGESGESASGRAYGRAQDKGDKAIYKAMTGAVKYWLYKSFLISTGDDPEVTSELDKAQGSGNGNQPPDEQEKLRKAYAKFEADAEHMRSLLNKEDLEAYVRSVRGEIEANPYAQYYWNLYNELKQSLPAKPGPPAA